MEENQETLIGDYTLRFMAEDEFDPIFRQHRDQIFGETLSFSVRGALSAAEVDAVERLSGRMGTLYSLHIAIYHQGELAGWSFGVQDGVDRFRMANTALFPQHQGKGVYTALLPRILRTVQQEGFQVVHSRHVATNNQVLVPKLKAGFVITGFEVTEMFGVLVHLSYFFNPLRRRALDFRVGQARPDEELRRHFAL